MELHSSTVLAAATWLHGCLTRLAPPLRCERLWQVQVEGCDISRLNSHVCFYLHRASRYGHFELKNELIEPAKCISLQAVLVMRTVFGRGVRLYLFDYEVWVKFGEDRKLPDVYSLRPLQRTL